MRFAAFLYVLLSLVSTVSGSPYFTEGSSDLSKLSPIFLHFENIFAKANPCVVSITTEQLNKSAAPSAPRKNLGSGFLIRADGHLLTNFHVVTTGDQITVTTYDGKNFLGRLIGKDPFTDVALVKIDAPGKWPTLSLGDSARVGVGAWALALGNPFGFHNTMTHGIISATGRVISNEISQKRFDNFIQMDVSINPGSSGGPLLDMFGKVIAINAAMTTSGAGVAFAIPINQVKEILPALYEQGEVQRGWIGAVFSKLPASAGFIILEVIRQSPAAKAGLRKGDRIFRINGRSFESLYQLSEMISALTPGSTIVVEVERKNVLRPIPITVANYNSVIPRP